MRDFDLNGPSIQLLRQTLRIGRYSGVVDLAFGLIIVFLLWQEGRALVALSWWGALAAVITMRMVLVRCLLSGTRLHEKNGENAYMVTAFAEGAAWASSLGWVAVQTSEGALLQFLLTCFCLVFSAFIYSARALTWFFYAAPLAVGQYIFWLHAAFIHSTLILVAWILSIIAAVTFAVGIRRTWGALLTLRQKAEETTRKAERNVAELTSSREQLRLALEALDVGISDTNFETDKRYYSSRYVEILGYLDRDAFLGSHRFSDAIHPHDRRRVLEARKAHLNGGQVFRQEFRMRRADQSYIWVMGRGESVRDTEGRATRFVLSIVDITERREAELAQAASARQYRALLNASPSLIWTCDDQGRLTFVSERACRLMYGYAPRDVVGRHVTEFNAPGFTQRQFISLVRPVLRGSPIFDAELQHFSAKGDIVSVTVSALPTRDENGKLESVIGVATDITALKRREYELNVALRNQQALFDAAGEGIAFVRAGRIDSANGALAKMLGVTREWLSGRPVEKILDSSDVWSCVLQTTIDAGYKNEAAIHEVTLRTFGLTGEVIDSQRTVWCQLTSRLIDDESNRYSHTGHAMILVLTDITALKRREELAWHQANHDELTGLPNRRLLGEHARRLLSVAMRQKRLAAVMVLDLDGFKEVNDVLGHAHGDALLRRVALRFSSVLREYDVVARTGGDEFVALLPEIENASIAVVIGEKMIAASTETLQHGNRNVRVHASIGIALFPADGQEFDSLLLRADEAMYAAKAAGKNQLRLASDLTLAQSSKVMALHQSKK